MIDVMCDSFISRFRVFAFTFILVSSLLIGDAFAVFKVFDTITTNQDTEIVVIDIHNIWMIKAQQHDNYIITGSDYEGVDIVKFLDFYRSAVNDNKKLVLGISASKIILSDSGIEYANKNSSNSNIENENIKIIKINPATYFAKFAADNSCVTVNNNNGWIFLDIASGHQDNPKNKNVYDSIAHTNENIRLLSQAGYKIVGVDNKDGDIDIVEKGQNILFFNNGLYSLFDEENGCLKSLLLDFFDDIKKR